MTPLARLVKELLCTCRIDALAAAALLVERTRGQAAQLMFELASALEEFQSECLILFRAANAVLVVETSIVAAYAII